MSERIDEEAAKRLEERVAGAVRRLVKLLSREPTKAAESAAGRAASLRRGPGWRASRGGEVLRAVFPFLQREAALAFVRQVLDRSHAEGWQADATLEADFSVHVTLRVEAGGADGAEGDHAATRRIDELYGWETWR